MKPTLRTLAVAGLAALGLAACETVGGLGQDIEAGGEAITGASNEAERDLE
jgi:predicted small secreted protein